MDLDVTGQRLVWSIWVYMACGEGALAMIRTATLEKVGEISSLGVFTEQDANHCQRIALIPASSCLSTNRGLIQ